MDRYVVFGNPIAHSLSPEIHARFAAAEGERISYERVLVPAGEFASHARRFFEEGGLGANVTLPFKADAFAFAHLRSARAEEAGAANFLARRRGGEGPATIEADNTDGAGLVADLTRNLGLELAGARILLLGAGGAARGVVGPLRALAPASIVIANRTLARAQELARRFGAPVRAVPLDAIPPERFDLVINATSGSTRGDAFVVDPRLFAGNVFAYDMAYGAAARAFVETAVAQGARASDGLGMLVEQAAESYFLWRGRRPATQPVIRELRDGAQAAR